MIATTTRPTTKITTTTTTTFLGCDSIEINIVFIASIATPSKLLSHILESSLKHPSCSHKMHFNLLESSLKPLETSLDHLYNTLEATSKSSIFLWNSLETPLNIPKKPLKLHWNILENSPALCHLHKWSTRSYSWSLSWEQLPIQYSLSFLWRDVQFCRWFYHYSKQDQPHWAGPDGGLKVQGGGALREGQQVSA